HHDAHQAYGGSALPPPCSAPASSWSVSNPHGVILPSEPGRRRAAYPAGDRCPRSVHLAGLLRLERVDQPLEGRQGGGDRAGVLVRELVEDRLEPVAPGGHAP